MKLFKTRQEVKRLQSQVEEIREMLVAHFDIKYSFDDFSNWLEANPAAKDIEVTTGEWRHFEDIIQPIGYKGKPTKAVSLSYRSVPLKVGKNK